MPDEQNKEGAAENSVRTISDKPVILDKLDYVYVSYSQVGVSTTDFRIAFGDRTPPEGHVKPLIGVVMTHAHAKALLEVLSSNVPKIDLLLERMAAKENKAPESAVQPQD